MRLRFTADQAGLSEYSWTIIESGFTVYSSSSVGSTFEYQFTKSNVVRNVEVTLETVNFANCAAPSSSEFFDVPIAETINAAFTATPPEQTFPNSTVALTNNSTGPGLTYLWDFGDGTTSTSANPGSKTYAAFGDYTITLIATSANGCVDSALQTIRIFPRPPLVDFAYAPDRGCAPLEVVFTNLSQYADDNSYFWNFGDGMGTSRAIHPTYIYTEPGIYTVSLSASNITGDTIREIKNEIIEVFPVPVADFIVKSNIVYIPDDPVYFRNDSRNASTYLWDFGDGTQSTDFQPVHNYTEEGLFTITLTATNTYGCQDIVVKENIVQTKIGGRLLVPNAFSPSQFGPSGGGLGEDPNSNDVFRPKVQGVVDYELLIYNRWGEMIFMSRDKNVGWDGYYKGELSPQDVYVYQIKAVFINGEKVIRTGDVNLIR
jgi:gliding motility-associated-like protein